MTSVTIENGLENLCYVTDVTDGKPLAASPLRAAACTGKPWSVTETAVLGKR
jgi:kynurenine formamidase